MESGFKAPRTAADNSRNGPAAPSGVGRDAFAVAETRMPEAEQPRRPAPSSRRRIPF